LRKTINDIATKDDLHGLATNIRTYQRKFIFYFAICSITQNVAFYLIMHFVAKR